MTERVAEFFPGLPGNIKAFRLASGMSQRALARACIPALLAVLQVAGMTLACTVVIVGAVVATAMFPAWVLCAGAIVAVAYVSMPR